MRSRAMLADAMIASFGIRDSEKSTVPASGAKIGSAKAYADSENARTERTDDALGRARFPDGPSKRRK